MIRYTSETYTCDNPYFVVGTEDVSKKIKTASQAVKMHAPVAVDEATGKVLPITSENIGTAKMYGIAAEDAAAEEEVLVYLTGGFLAEGVALPEDVTLDKLEIPLRDIGIFLK